MIGRWRVRGPLQLPSQSSEVLGKIAIAIGLSVAGFRRETELFGRARPALQANAGNDRLWRLQLIGELFDSATPSGSRQSGDESMSSRITIDPKVYHGQACIKGTRVPVYQIPRMLAHGDTIADLLEEYPSLTREEMAACLD